MGDAILFLWRVCLWIVVFDATVRCSYLKLLTLFILHLWLKKTLNIVVPKWFGLVLTWWEKKSNLGYNCFLNWHLKWDTFTWFSLTTFGCSAITLTICDTYSLSNYYLIKWGTKDLSNLRHNCFLNWSFTWFALSMFGLADKWVPPPPEKRTKPIANMSFPLRLLSNKMRDYIISN